MDKRISYKIVLDTETCPIDKEFEGVSPYNMFTYDIGWAIVDKRGNVYQTRSFIVKDIFEDENELMKSAYYANKIPMYLEEIASGKRIVANFYEIRQTLKNDIETFAVKEIYAHNMRFDYGATNNTQRWLSKSKYRYFFPYDVTVCDTLKMSRQVIGKMPTYRNFCEKNGYLTKNGQLRFTAEILYRFISKNDTFVESHTGLEDVLIEKEILAYCFRQHKKMTKELWERG